MTKRIFTGTLPLIAGGLIYIIYRSQTLVMFSWFYKMGLMSSVDTLRSNHYLNYYIVPNWIKYSLPDALWLFSFTYISFLIWDFKINKQSFLWILIAPIIGIGSELGQLTRIIPGTFDKIDLILLIISSFLPFLITKYTKTIKKI